MTFLKRLYRNVSWPPAATTRSSLGLNTVVCRYSIVISIAFFYLLSIDQGSAIKCWVCRSDGDPKCSDPFDNTSFPITDCKQANPRDHLPGLESTMCRKVRQKVNGNWRYIRSCAWLGEPGIGRDERYCIHRSGTYNIHVEYCTCRSKDGCNGATEFASKPFNAAFLAISTVIYYFCNNQRLL